MGAILSREKLSSSIVSDPNQNIRAVIFRKDRSGSPIIITNLPNKLVFHHAGVFESNDGDKLTLRSILYDDFSIFKLFQNWRNPNAPEILSSRLSEIELDLVKKTMLSSKTISDETQMDFPCPDEFNANISYFSAGDPVLNEAFTATSIVKLNMSTGEKLKTQAEPNRALGATVFVPRSNGQGWLLNMGYYRYQKFCRFKAPSTGVDRNLYTAWFSWVF
jgi:carotenoid cleavage dioxygenase-like enzyme